MAEVEKVAIGDITIGERSRKEYRHIERMCESLRRIGMLHPVICNTHLELIAGGRRLEAAKRLKWEAVPVIRVAHLDDAVLAIVAERDDNTCRDPLTPTEMVEQGRRLEALEKPKAAERKAATQAKPGQGKTGSGKLPEPANRGETREKVAEAVGTSATTYRNAKEVVEAAETDPERNGDLPAKMDAESVNAAHKELRKRKQTTKRDDLTDAVGCPVPDRLRDVFGDPWLADLATIIDDIRTTINSSKIAGVIKGKSQAYGAFLRAGEMLKALAAADDLLEDVEDDIKAGTPHAVHAACAGKGCKDCRKMGWVPKWRFEELAQEAAR